MSAPTINNYFYGTIGQHIDHVEHQILTIDKEGTIRIEQVENQQSSAPKTRETKIPEFKYIHYKVTDPNKRAEVHAAVTNIVRLPKISQVCTALKQLMKDEQILSSIDQSAMLAELRRLGLPDASEPGFSDKNFFSLYNN